MATAAAPAPAPSNPAPAAAVTPADSDDPASTVQKGAKSFGLDFSLLPKFASHAEHRAHLKARLAAAFRLFGKNGYDEGAAGHITVRDPERKDCFWVNPFGRPFSMITLSDLLLVDHEGNVVEGGKPGMGQLVNRAAFEIHSKIHAARPDVTAACHAHTTYGRAFSVFGRTLPITTQDACAFHRGLKVYADFKGVVLSEGEGLRIAKALGDDGKAVIMQNHGFLTVGPTIEAAVFWFVTLERLCRLQMMVDAVEAARGASADGGDGDGWRAKEIGEAEREFTWRQIGHEFSGWFQGNAYLMEMEDQLHGAHLK
ncbi:class II aldolase/adducin domain protein [Zopfochytrium polystomum]|nr:class II aldolase/adducin domain protein [Zopfochytrium polystomum]